MFEEYENRDYKIMPMGMEYGIVFTRLGDDMLIDTDIVCGDIDTAKHVIEGLKLKDAEMRAEADSW